MTIDPVLIPPGKGSAYWVTGDLYTFKAVSKDTGEAYTLMELVIQPNGGAPPHIHTQEDEAFYIQEGELKFQLDEQIIVATPGTFLHSPKGQIHSFTNIGTTPAKVLCWNTPAGLENFFAEVGKPVQHTDSEPPLVSAADIEKLLATAPKYGLEIIPPPST